MQREFLMKRQAVRIVRTRQEEFSWQSTASSEDRKHTSGGVFIAVDSNLGTVVGDREGAVASIPGNEGRITQAWVNVRGGTRVFAVYFWHSEGRTPRNEALLEAVPKRARVTRHPWMMARDANMSPVVLENSLWFQRNWMHLVALESASTCRSKGTKRERIEKVYDFSLRVTVR